MTNPPPTHRRTSPRPDRILVAALLCAATLLGTPPPAAGVPPHPRRLEYRVAWNGIPAAAATVAIRPVEHDGAERLEVEARARTNAFVDLFWSFRGTARATFLADELMPLHFDYARTMRGTPHHTVIDFDPARRHARAVYVKGSRRRELAVDDRPVLDPITAVFRARLSGAGPGDVREYDVFTGESFYRVRLTVVAADDVVVPAGRFPALRVVPEVWKVTHTAQLDPRLRGATIWVADDPLRTLLRIRSEVFVGAVTLELTAVDA